MIDERGVVELPEIGQDQGRQPQAVDGPPGCEAEHLVAGGRCGEGRLLFVVIGAQFLEDAWCGQGFGVEGKAGGWFTRRGHPTGFPHGEDDQGMLLGQFQGRVFANLRQLLPWRGSVFIRVTHEMVAAAGRGVVGCLLAAEYSTDSHPRQPAGWGTAWPDCG